MTTKKKDPLKGLTEKTKLELKVVDDNYIKDYTPKVLSREEKAIEVRAFLKKAKELAMRAAELGNKDEKEEV